ncbi:hypothetical protein COB21_05260 [Candidatus Aerophobetes bacterium]|uniref:Fe2OG dioxygenase domain-containing protein n=1 Tax=Aerophobetes bacterium TaxID=2030807 RepID=A0A2A4WZX0_UNCAE|nr:MAG: hypothetical protein COB21_05260 [Candidatus Aerophobetes bacterium]
MKKRVIVVGLAMLLSSTSIFAACCGPCAKNVIHYADFHRPDKQEQILAIINKGFVEQGFVFICGVPIEEEELSKAFLESKKFFQKPESEKRKFIGSKWNYQTGYCPLRIERAKDHFLSDQKESFMLSLHPSKECPNLTPSKQFLKTLTSIGNKMMVIAIESLELIEQSLGLEKGRFANFLGDSDTTTFRTMCNKAFALDSSEKVWNEVHTDIGFITLNPRPTVEGLFAQDKKGNWKWVDIPKNSLMLKVGDQLQNITNGYFMSAKYMVAASDTTRYQDRYTLSLYCHPSGPTDLTPLPQLVKKTGGVALYPKVTRDELLLERLIDINLAGESSMRNLEESGVVDRLKEKKMASPRVMKKLESYKSRKHTMQLNS